MSSIGSGGVVFGVQCAGAIGSSQSAGEGGGPSVDHCGPFSAQTEPEKWLKSRQFGKKALIFVLNQKHSGYMETTKRI